MATSNLLGGNQTNQILAQRRAQEFMRLLQSRRMAESRPTATQTQAPTRRLEPSDLNKSFGALRQALGALAPLNIPGLGVVSGAAGIGSAITNPYMNNWQKAIAAAQGGTQALGSGAAMLGSNLGGLTGYLPYVGAALGAAGILSSNAPDNVKAGQATQLLTQLILQKLVSAGLAAGAGGAAAGGAAASTAGGASAGLATGALAGLVAAPFAAALGGIITHEIGPGDYAEHRRKAASDARQTIPWVFERIGMAQSPEEIDAILAGDFNYGLPNLLGGRTPESLRRIQYAPGVGFTGGYEMGAQNFPEINRQIQEYAAQMKQMLSDPGTWGQALRQTQDQAFSNYTSRTGYGQSAITYGDVESLQFRNVNLSDPRIADAVQQYRNQGDNILVAHHKAITQLSPILAAEEAEKDRLAAQEWLGTYGTASA